MSNVKLTYPLYVYARTTTIRGIGSDLDIDQEKKKIEVYVGFEPTIS